MWMENGKKNKIKEQFKAEMSTRDHTLLPGSPAVHLVSLCLICGHLWCALSLSSHLVSPCAPAASTGHHSRTFSPHARCQATGLACRRQAVPSGSIAEPTDMLRGAVVVPSLILDRPPGQAPPVSIILSTCITCAELASSSGSTTGRNPDQQPTLKYSNYRCHLLDSSPPSL